MDLKPLKLGMAYHGNRMPSHARQDMQEMARNGLDLVVHMLSHNDWDRHKSVMRDIVAISQDAGLEVWLDNWGLGGPPGDKSHFLSYYPESHMYYSDGKMVPTYVCLRSPDFMRFMKEWVDTVAWMGVKTIFWDEPHLPHKQENGRRYYGCACPRCRRLFEEKYGRPMPKELDAEAEAFAVDGLIDYFREITTYSAQKGITNTVCVMLGSFGMSLSAADKICALPTISNIGSDPYWVGGETPAYEYVYRGTRENLALCERFQKDHNIWIQCYNNPRGKEEEIVGAAEAAYDAGARTIIGWSFRGAESNDYHAANPDVAWARTMDAMRRVREMERDRLLAIYREKYRK